MGMQRQQARPTQTVEPTQQRSAAAYKRPPLMQAPLHPILRLQQTIGNQAIQRLLRSGRLQAKLAVSQPGDPYEQEADRVADQVMRMSAPTTIGLASGAIQRKCAGCEEEEKGLVRRKIQRSSETADVSVPDSFLSNLGPGRPLDSSARAYFEPRFGHDFSQVRVHTDSKAAESARGVNALAYTVGRDVVFGAGQYAPGTSQGRQLLAHELTHVVRQWGASGMHHAIGSRGHNHLIQRQRDPRRTRERRTQEQRTPEQRDALIQDVLGAIAANEVGGRAQAVESRLGTSSGRAASYASATQMIPSHAITVLRHEPEYAAVHGLDSHGMERATAIDHAVRRVWGAIVENQTDVPNVRTRYASEIATAHLTQDDLAAMQRFGALRSEIGRHVRRVPLEGGQEGETRRAVVTESRILAELTTRREAARKQLARMIASELRAAAGVVAQTGAIETPTTVPVETEAPETTIAEIAEVRAAIDAFPIRLEQWRLVVPGPPAIPRGLLDRPARGRRPTQSRSAERVRWLQTRRDRLMAINLVTEARRISQQALAVELHPMYAGLGDLREGDIAAYVRGNRSGTVSVWGEDLNGWIRLALSRERTRPDGPTLDDVIASAASHEGGYALSRLEYQRVISEYLDDHPTATDRAVVRVAARRNAGAPEAYFRRIWPHFQRLQRERAAREAAATQ